MTPRPTAAMNVLVEERRGGHVPREPDGRLSVRVVNCLKNEGLAAYEPGGGALLDPAAIAALDERHLLRVPNFAKVSLRELAAWLRARGHRPDWPTADRVPLRRRDRLALEAEVERLTRENADLRARGDKKG